MQRLRIDAVHSMTSREVHMSQTVGPRTHSLITSYTTANGITRRATRRSATASDTISQLDGVRSFRTILTAVQTSKLPTTVPAMIAAQPMIIKTTAQTGYLRPLVTGGSPVEIVWLKNRLVSPMAGKFVCSVMETVVCWTPYCVTSSARLSVLLRANIAVVWRKESMA